MLMLIGISAATTVPHLNGTLGRWQLKETARNLEVTLQFASQWARVRQEAIAFVLDVRQGSFMLRPLGDEGSLGEASLPVGRQSFGRGVEIARMEGLIDLGKEKILMFRPDGTSPAATIVLTGSQPDANRETLWQIALNGRGAVQCRERLADETGG